MTAAGAHTMAVDADEVTFTFANDLPAEAITNTENFLNEVVQFQLAAVYRNGEENTLTKFNKEAAKTAKLSEADNLTTAEVSTMLAKERTAAVSTSQKLEDLGGWNTKIDWSKVQLKQGTTAKEIVMTIKPELIKATDLADPEKANAKAFQGDLTVNSYNITFYKKGDTSTKYKITLKPSTTEDAQAIATFVTVAPKN